MSQIKKLLLSVVMTAIVSASAFAASGFEAILNVPIGMSVGIQNLALTKDGKNYVIGDSKIEDVYKNKSAVGFDAGISAQIGYMIQVKDGFGISILGELGYSHDTFAFVNAKDKKLTVSMTFESIQIGLLPKFNIGAFAIGIGGGVKIPVSGQMNAKDYDESNKLESYKLKWKDFKDNMLDGTPIIGYIKATFDYSIFFTEKLALNVGLYTGFDFAPSMIDKMNRGYTSEGSPKAFDKYGIYSFDIGLQLGLKFGPKA